MSEKKLLNKGEIFLLVIAVLIIGYLVLKNNGIHIVERHENVELLDKPNTKNYSKRKNISREQAESRAEIERMLQKLSANLSDNKHTTKDAKLSDDEVKFHKELNEKYKWEEKYDDASDWLNVLKASHQTYSKVRKVFEDPDNPKSDAQYLVEDVSRLLSNKYVANSIYDKIEQTFAIPKENSKSFAKKGKKSVSDWAKFIEANQ